MNSKLTQIKVFNIQSKPLSNWETQIGANTAEAIIINEYINFKRVDGSSSFKVSPNKLEWVVPKQEPFG